VEKQAPVLWGGKDVKKALIHIKEM